MPTPYEQIQELKKQLHCNIPDLLVEANQNDPFYVGTDTEIIMAEWFAKLWRKFGYGAGVHLRRIHYSLLSRNLKKPDGQPYINTENCWQYVCKAGGYTRYLGLVDPAAFVDRKNPSPRIYHYSGYVEKPEWHSVQYSNWDLPVIGVSSDYDLSWHVPHYEVAGYHCESYKALQPYHVEIWCEKSTMNDVLIPICSEQQVNLVTGEGFMSITSVIRLLLRARESGKPVRILYISDFDPAGDVMPPSIARQIEFWLNYFGFTEDIKLTPLILTREQVQQYKLPRIPIKEEDKRKTKFEEHYGEGAVELDALEALYPGESARIIREAISQFRDDNLSDKICQANETLEQRVKEAFENTIYPYQGQLDEIEKEVEEIADRYYDRVRELNQSLQKELEPHGRKLESLSQDIKESIDNMDIDIPALPEPNVQTEDDNWLFDSKRDYLEQLKYYKLHQGKTKRRKKRTAYDAETMSFKEVEE